MLHQHRRSNVARAHERYAVAKTFVSLALETHALWSNDYNRHECDCELMMIYGAVMIGHVEGRPMNASKLSHYLGLPRTTVLRKLDQLIEADVVVRHGRYYCISDSRRVSPKSDYLRRASHIIREGARILNEVQ